MCHIPAKSWVKRGMVLVLVLVSKTNNTVYPAFSWIVTITTITPTKIKSGKAKKNEEIFLLLQDRSSRKSMFRSSKRSSSERGSSLPRRKSSAKEVKVAQDEHSDVAFKGADMF